MSDERLRCRCAWSALRALSAIHGEAGEDEAMFRLAEERCPDRATGEDGLCDGCRSGDHICRRYPQGARLVPFAETAQPNAAYGVPSCRN